MAYSTPLTAVSSTPLTAAQWNASVRDNILVTPAALATTAGRIFVTTGANAVAERAIASANVSAAETCTSATHVAIATPGPAVTLTTGTSAIALCAAQVSHNTNGVFSGFAVAVTGASAIAATDAQGSLFQPATAASSGVRFSVAVHYPGTLTPGSNTFTLLYRTSAPTATFGLRNIIVIAL
jgi:hypothetical protein